MSGQVHPGRSAFWDSIKSLFRLSTVVALGLGFAMATALKHVGSPDLSGAVFGADATLVALIVPTAALANTYLEGRMLEYLAKILASGKVKDMADLGASVDRHAKSVVACVQPLLRGFTFLLVSFGFSVASLFKSTNSIWPSGPGWLRLSLLDLRVGGALGFDLVGVLLLFPFAWSMLDRQLAQKTSELITWQSEKYRIENELAQAAAKKAAKEEDAREKDAAQATTQTNTPGQIIKLATAYHPRGGRSIVFRQY